MQNRDIEYVNWFLFLRYFHQLTSCLACVRFTLSNVSFIFDLRVKLNALYSHSAININKLKEEVVRWSFEAPWTSLCSDLVAVISHDEKKFGLLQTDWSTRWEHLIRYPIKVLVNSTHKLRLFTMERVLTNMIIIRWMPAVKAVSVSWWNEFFVSKSRS